ncbi:hypothetical protein M9R32_11495 [Paenisporosarcina quisquiliarum]|uniref:Uncharacterized protein n=1 Tax=Paenisporosarcina quisquiliarum TaxID=365346 RepID=A0A9X3LH33_9BACL|nr:hypothetical protein [Paenisporosarcina quisquiliarum]MCZ8537808.1 hypothetical protein [Paenisporosarcina quisquiliarum]
MEIYHPLLQSGLIKPPPLEEMLLDENRMVSSKEIRDQTKSMRLKEVNKKTRPTDKKK